MTNLKKIISIGKNLQLKRPCCSMLRQNFSAECEKAVNNQINMELTGSYEYLAMAFYCHDKALHGAYKFFKEASLDESHHAHQFMEYLNKRGGKIKLEAIPAPKSRYDTLLEAMREALKLEITVNQSLLELHELASQEGDPNLCDFIETTFLQEQVDSQKQIADHIRSLERCEKDIGTFLFDVYLSKEASLHKTE